VGNTYQLGIGGDLIVAVEGQSVDSADALRRAMNKKRSADLLTMTVYRGGHNVDVKITLGEAPQQL
jgi:S1-C subfamily serine protease